MAGIRPERIEQTEKSCSACGGTIVKRVVEYEDSEWVQECYCEACGLRYEPSIIDY